MKMKKMMPPRCSKRGGIKNIFHGPALQGEEDPMASPSFGL
jgi:hypothetical protein